MLDERILILTDNNAPKNVRHITGMGEGGTRFDVYISPYESLGEHGFVNTQAPNTSVVTHRHASVIRKIKK